MVIDYVMYYATRLFLQDINMQIGSKVRLTSVFGTYQLALLMVTRGNARSGRAVATVARTRFEG